VPSCTSAAEASLNGLRRCSVRRALSTAGLSQRRQPATRGTAKASKRLPGALGWLFEQPEADDRRMNSWINACPPPERRLRNTLRTPLTDLSCSQGACGSAELDEERSKRELQTERIAMLTREIGRYKPQEAPVLQAGRLRLDRIKALSEPADLGNVLDVLAAEKADGPLPCVPVDLSDSPPLDTLGSRGMRGLANPRAGFQELEEIARNVAAKHMESIPSLVAYLMPPASTDEQRAWVFFCWVCHHVACDIEDTHVDADAVLVSRRCGRQSYAGLYCRLCKQAGLDAKVISGDVMEFSALQNRAGGNITAPHMWNSVLLQNNWCFVDCAFGAGMCSRGDEFEHRFRPHFFGLAPEELSFSHHPNDSESQLLAPLLRREEFLRQPFVTTDVFFGHGLSFFPEERPQRRIALKDSNMGSVRLRMPEGVELETALDGVSTRCLQERGGIIMTTRIKITVMSAKRLRNTDVLGGSDLCDPYCTCEVLGKPHTRCQTKALKDTLEPRWDENFFIEDCAVGDDLHFAVYDKDIGSRDDLLGQTTLPSLCFHTGTGFDDWMDLDDDGIMGSLLRVRVEPLGTKEKRIGGEEDVTTVHFRAPKALTEQVLEVRARRTASDEGFRCACAFTVIVPPEPKVFVEPSFPNVRWETFNTHGLAFMAALPLGHYTLKDNNELRFQLSAPIDVQAMADVDGDTTLAFVQRSSAGIVVMSQCPPGSHQLRLQVRRSDASEYACAVTYTVSPLPGCRIRTLGFPEASTMFQEAGAWLEAPLTRRLCAGPTTFQLRLNSQHVVKLMIVTPGEMRQEIPSKGRGAFRGVAKVAEPEATLCSIMLDGDMRVLLRWAVAAC